MNTQDEILRSVVIHYIQESLPIGSAQLQKEFNLNVSSATIRNYFKKLVLEGMLIQAHSSSGREPSHEALVNFWQDELDGSKSVTISSLKDLELFSNKFGIFAMLLQDKSSMKLSFVKDIDDLLILKIGDKTAYIKCDIAVKRFFQEFDGHLIKDILQIAKHLGVFSIIDTLRPFLISTKIKANIEALVKIAYTNKEWAESMLEKFLDGRVVFDLQSGVNTKLNPEGSLTYLQECYLNSEPFKLMCVGESKSNFRAFLDSITI
jgi:heat-inducible transcriptional repressor